MRFFSAIVRLLVRGQSVQPEKGNLNATIQRLTNESAFRSLLHERRVRLVRGLLRGDDLKEREINRAALRRAR